MSFRPFCLLTLVFSSFIAFSSLEAATTAEQRSEINAASALMTKAGSLFVERKFQEAGEVVKEAQTRLANVALGADQPTMLLITPIHKRLEVAHSKLKAEGVSLPELKPLPEPKAAAEAKSTEAKTTPKMATAKPAAKPAAKAATAKMDKKGGAATSFVKDVAPILNSRCGGCHVRNARGMFSMATYEALMKGPPAGRVVTPGNLEGSNLIIKVQDKEMPPNGAGIPDAELATLKKWVQEGAKFDGPSSSAQLVSYITAGNAPAGKAGGSIQRASGSETVSFASDIAPIIVKNCIGCHNAQNPPANLNLLTTANLFRGGDRGDPILPGKAADSLLLKKLKGTAEGARMPQRAKPLDDATIAKVETWISEGARFDGAGETMPLMQVAAIAKAKNSSHEQLTKDRVELAQENWRLGMPGTTPSKAESENFLVLGNVDESTLADIAKRAEMLAPKVGKIFNAPPDQPLVKGRTTLFILGERYDYAEFGKMVEKRELPPTTRGHYKFSIVDAYGAVLVPKNNEYDLDTLIAQQLGAVYVASLGQNVPHWFAEGCGRVVAARQAGNDRRVAQWEAELSGVMGSMSKPDDFLTGKLSAENADICSFSFARFLMENRRFTAMISNLRKGGDFSKVFADAFGGTPEQLAAAWAGGWTKGGRIRTK
jgi:mono/diheme cytochrome c family protein